MVHVVQLERGLRDLHRDASIGTHLGVVANAPQQAVRHARGATRALGDFVRSTRVHLDFQYFACAAHDHFELVDRIETQLLHDAEACAQRCGEHTQPGRRANERELLDVHRDRLRFRAIG